VPATVYITAVDATVLRHAGCTCVLLRIGAPGRVCAVVSADVTRLLYLRQVAMIAGVLVNDTCICALNASLG
jgi:hypothetical protein